MRKILLESSKVCLRAALVFGVLNALLFSCGEGIQLFPFPAERIARGENSSLINNQDGEYRENLFRFEKGEGNLLSKLQRSAKDFWAESFITPKGSPVFKSVAAFYADSLQNPAVFKSRSTPLSVGSRAPPVS